MAPRIPSPTSCSDMSEGEAAFVVMKAQSSSRGNTEQRQDNVRCHSDSALRNGSFSSWNNLSCELSPSGKPKRRISFDERVSVREFESGSWNSVTDMKQFFAPPSPPNIRSSPSDGPVPRVILCPYRQDSMDHVTHDMFPLYECHHTDCNMQQLLQREIRHILMVDPHDIFLQIFTKRIQQALGSHVTLVTAHSAEEALVLCSQRTFDVIISEERLSLFHRHAGSGDNLKPTSGSALFKHLGQYYPEQCNQSLLIGVSAHWQSDHITLEQSGADYCWSKAPPPDLSMQVLKDLLHTLLYKRGKHDMAKSLLMTCDNHASEALPSSPQPAGPSRKQ